MKKYTYLKVIQQNYGHWGWEDVSKYEIYSTGCAPKEQRQLLAHDLKEYRLTGYPTRVISRKELNTVGV